MRIDFIIQNKPDKNALKRFYKRHRYSASFMGYDSAVIATIDSEIIGAVIVSRITPTNTQAFLHGVFVSTFHRQRGIAQNLIKHGMLLADNLSCFVSPALMPLYKKLAFKQTTPQELTLPLLQRFNAYSRKQQLTIFTYTR